MVAMQSLQEINHAIAQRFLLSQDCNTSVAYMFLRLMEEEPHTTSKPKRWHTPCLGSWGWAKIEFRV